MKTYIVLLLCCLAIGGALFADGQPEQPTGELEAWMQLVKVGPYTPDKEDWDGVYEKAKQEGKVVIYTSSSLIFDAVAPFEKAYPGIKVEAYNMTAVEIMEKLQRETEAGMHTVDILLTTINADELRHLMESDVLVNYVPPELKGLIPRELREPVLSNRIGANVWIYNDTVYKEQPFKSLWELTLPEWKGRVIVRDPMRSQGTMHTFVSWVGNADALAEDYKRVFGKPLGLSTPNAGYELVLRLLNNDLQLATGSKDILNAVCQDDLANPPIGQVTASQYRDVLAGKRQFAIAWDVTPSCGYATLTRLPLVALAPNPNAAKLLILWLMGCPDGTGEGLQALNVPGTFPVRSDVPLQEPFKPISNYNFWYEDMESIAEYGADVMDFWLEHM